MIVRWMGAVVMAGLVASGARGSFALVVAKGGLKLHEAKPGDTYANGQKRDDGKPYGKVFSMGNGSVSQQGTSLDTLVMNLPMSWTRQG